MWAQTWGNLFDMVVPYPDVKKKDLTQILLDNEYTPEKLFRVIIFNLHSTETRAIFIPIFGLA